MPVGALESRRTVTVVFCDLKDSTGLSERLEMEALHDVLGSYFAAMQDAIKAHGGTVEKHIGDAIMASRGHTAASFRTRRADSRSRWRHAGVLGP